jgi:hypothetical protein
MNKIALISYYADGCSEGGKKQIAKQGTWTLHGLTEQSLTNLS